MKTLYLTIILALFLVTQVWCIDEPPKSSKTKRDVYNYNNPPNYNDNYDCKSPPACLPISSIPPDTDVDLSWYNATTLFYIPMESCWGYKQFANMFLGREVFSYRELEEMCLYTFFGHSPPQTYGGYGKQVYQNCVAADVDIDAANCTFTGGDSGTDSTIQRYEIDYVVLSDGKSWLATYRCVDNRYGDFQVYSTRPYLEQNVVTQVMAMAVNKLGFSATDIKLLQCKFPTYPIPFQNYPEPDPALSKSCSYPSSYSSPSQAPPASNPPHYNPHPYPNHPNPY